MAQDFGDRAFRDRRRFFPQNFPSTFFSSGNHLISNVTSDKDNSSEPMFEKSLRRPLMMQVQVHQCYFSRASIDKLPDNLFISHLRHLPPFLHHTFQPLPLKRHNLTTPSNENHIIFSWKTPHQAIHFLVEGIPGSFPRIPSKLLFSPQQLGFI